MSAAVLFLDGRAYDGLLLSNIKETATEISGYVINGNFDFTLSGNVARCYSTAGKLMNEFPATLSHIVTVPKNANLRDYNAVIEWASEQFAEERNKL